MPRNTDPRFMNSLGHYDDSLFQKWYYQQNRERKLKMQAEYRKANPETTKAAVDNWRKYNPEKRKASSLSYYHRNKEKYIAKAAARRAKKLQAMPSWLDESDLKAIETLYKQSIKMNKEAGKIVSHVDHIIPLQGKNVSGLHVPWNLQLMNAIENLRKHAKY